MVMYPQHYRNWRYQKSEAAKNSQTFTDYLLNFKNGIVAEAEEVDPAEKGQLKRSVVTTTYFRSTPNIS